MSRPRPNILLALADDASHFSAYGHGFVHTPHFDRVARDGVRFDAMFTTNPKCAPSRASLLTGKHTWQLEEACNHYCVFPGPDRLEVYPDLLEAAGYHVGYTGKGWDPGDWKRQGRTRNPAGTEYNALTLTPPEGSKIKDHDYAGNFAAFLDTRRGDTDGGQPFCFWYGGKEPHRPYAFGESLRHGKSLDEIHAGDVPPYWPDNRTVRTDLLDYAFETEWFDDQLGQMLSLLEERGELDNTLVIVTSDNGCPFPRVKGQMFDDDFRLPCAAMWPAAIPPGRVVEDLCSFIDLCPTFLELAGLEIPESLPGRSLMDVLSASGASGGGRISPQRDRAFMGRECHDLGREDDVGYPVRCVRTPTHLYVRNFSPELWPAGNPETRYTNCDSSPTKEYILAMHRGGASHFHDLSFGKRPGEQLFDVVADPFCMTNLADDPAHRPAADTLWHELEAVLRATGDPRIDGRGDIFNQYEYVGHERASHSWKAWVEGWWRPPPY